MKARYSISADSPSSGQNRTSRSGSCSETVSRHAFALPIRLSSSMMSRAITFSLEFVASAPGGRDQHPASFETAASRLPQDEVFLNAIKHVPHPEGAQRARLEGRRM